MIQIDPAYRPYYITQQIEKIRRFAEVSKTKDVCAMMVQLMDACDCWHLNGGFGQTVHEFVDFVRANYQRGLGHSPALPVKIIMDDWISSTGSLIIPPTWRVDEMYLFGWLACFALHEDFTPVDARVEFDTRQGEFLIWKMRKIEN